MLLLGVSARAVPLGRLRFQAIYPGTKDAVGCARVCVGKFIWLLCAVGRLRQVTFDVCLRADALVFCNPMVASRSELLHQYCCLATLYDMTSCIFR